MKKLKYLVLILMILVFLSGLGVLLYPYIRGYLVDRQIERTAEEFLSRVETDPISPWEAGNCAISRTFFIRFPNH